MFFYSNPIKYNIAWDVSKLTIKTGLDFSSAQFDPNCKDLKSSPVPISQDLEWASHAEWIMNYTQSVDWINSGPVLRTGSTNLHH